MIKRFCFRIELTGTGKTAAEAWAQAVDAFAKEPGDHPPMEEDLRNSHNGPPILGTQYTIDEGRNTDLDCDPGRIGTA